MNNLRIRLLGNFHLEYEDRPITGQFSHRLQSLLTFLLIHRDDPQSRQSIAYAFWPDSTESQARTNLRQLLYHLRDALPDEDKFLEVNRENLYWNKDSPYELDVAAFERSFGLAGDARETGDHDGMIDQLEKGLNQYRGDLLPDCYDEWIIPKRNRLSQRYVDGLEQLVERLKTGREYRRAIEYAQQLLRYDPHRESNYRQLMRLHVLNDDRGRAIKSYRQCEEVFQTELDTEPSEATQSLFDQIQGSDSTENESIEPDIPLVGRQTEWEVFLDTWNQTMHGEPRMFLIDGEVGIGKTRLAEEAIRWAGKQGVRTAVSRAHAGEGTLAFAPVADWLRSDAIYPELSRLSSIWVSELTRLLPELREKQYDLDTEFPPQVEEWRRHRLFEALARGIFTVDQPLMLVLDDLQWCDTDSLEWFSYLLRFNLEKSLLVIATARTEELNQDHPVTSLLVELRGREQLSELSLSALNEGDATELARCVAKGDLSTDHAKQLYQQTGGQPLFLVETVRAGKGSNIQEGTDSSLESPKIQSAIDYRLSQLSSEGRTAVELASVVGQEFTYSMLEEASSLEPGVLAQGLDELLEFRILREREGNRYDFSHNRLRDVAYDRVGKTRRKVLHRQVAEALELLHQDELQRVSGRAARHFREAGLYHRALPHFYRSGRRGLRLSAYQEAQEQLEQGLELLEWVPEDASKVELEIELQSNLGTAISAREGWSSKAAEAAFSRARRLCREVEDSDRIFHVLWGLWCFYIVRGELQAGRDLAEQHLELSNNQADEIQQAAGSFMMGASLFHLGKPGSAVRHLHESLKHYKASSDVTPAFLTSPDLRVFRASYASHACWVEGNREGGFEENDRALEIAQSLEHPFTTTVAYAYGAMLHQLDRDPRRTLDLAEQTISLCSDHGFPYYLAWGRILRAWCRAVNGDWNDGVDGIREGLSDIRQQGAALREPYYLGLLAEVQGGAGEPGGALETLTEAKEITRRTKQRFFQAELHRIHAGLLRKLRPGDREVENQLRRAVEVSRNQGASVFEARGLIDLARELKDRGRVEEARELLLEAKPSVDSDQNSRSVQNLHSLSEELGLEEP